MNAELDTNAPVVDLTVAVAFYEPAGFGVRVHTDDNGDGGEGLAFVDHDGPACSHGFYLRG